MAAHNARAGLGAVGSCRRLMWACSMGLALTCGASVAGAQGGAAVQAEALFREGKSLLDQKNYDQACPKLAASYRIDPATGTLLALAVCHEQQGKTASAWEEYLEAGRRAKTEGRADREKAAKERAAALEKQLSRLSVTVAPGADKIAGLEVKRDGATVDPAAWGTAMPVDPGTHTIEAAAPGRNPWKTTVTVQKKGATDVVTVPMLTEAPKAAVVAPVPTPGEASKASPAPSNGKTLTSPPQQPANGTSDSKKTLRTLSYVTGGVGVVGIGIGSFFGLKAMSKNSDSKNDCDGNICGPVGLSARNDARSAGNIATVGFIAGGALLATGAVLWVSSRGTTEVRAAPAVGQNQVGLLVGGAFE